MAINFNKLFLQNLLPNRHPSANTATHDACDNGSVSDYDNDYTERAHANSSFFLDNQNDKLTQALEALRRIITTHKVHQQRHGRRQVLKPQTTSSTVEGVHSGPLRGSSSNRDQAVRIKPQEYQRLPTRNNVSWDNHRMSVLGHRGHHHRRSLQGYHPYSVDLAPTVLGLSGDKSFKGNDRLSRTADKVVVEVRVVFLKIGEIDTLKETFRADAFIQARWPEPRLNEKSEEELARIDLSKCWNPLIYIENILSESKDQHWMSVSHNSKGETVLTERRRLRGIFLETLELDDFPLDVQDLTITLSSERPDTEVDLVPDNKDLCAINIQTFVDQQEWHLHEHIEISKRSVVQEFSNSSQSHSCLSVTCRAARRPGYFYWNVFLIMFFITGLSFPTFAVSAERPENRLQLSFTLFLTSVAFKFVINQSLPKISYLTFMDKYVLMSLGVLCVVSVWHAAVTLVPAYSLPDQSLKNPTNTGLLMDEWNYLPLFQSCLPQGRNFQEWLGLLESLQLFNSSKPKLPFTGSPNLLIPRRAIPKWMDDSLTDALRFKPTSTNETNEGRELTILQRAIHLALQRRLLERQKQVDLIRAEMKELEDQRTNLLNRVERGVFIAFCIFYFVAHIVFICWVYFGAGKRRREMIERDKQYRTWMRKRLDWTESNPVSRPPIPVNKTA